MMPISARSRSPVIVADPGGFGPPPLDKNGKPAFDKKSRPLRGPLVPAADASRIGAAHDAIQSPDPRERAWPNIVRLLPTQLKRTHLGPVLQARPWRL